MAIKTNRKRFKKQDIEKLNKTTVNLVYNVDRGERATISRIEFIGDN